MPTAFGEKVVMRIFTPEVLVRDFSELGFSIEDRDRWNKMIKEPNGIILGDRPDGLRQDDHAVLVAQATGDARGERLHVEDPIEMIEPLFNQMQVQPAIGVDFAHGVRTLMRQDPDIIMVGEIRDRDTADMAVQAALTGHLVSRRCTPTTRRPR
jgi:general secretion pathway protein E